MKTGETVTDLGLYTSECCSFERVFDTGDRFANCPQCSLSCVWEMEEELTTEDNVEPMNVVAA